MSEIDELAEIVAALEMVQLAFSTLILLYITRMKYDYSWFSALKSRAFCEPSSSTFFSDSFSPSYFSFLA